MADVQLFKSPGRNPFDHSRNGSSLPATVSSPQLAFNAPEDIQIPPSSPSICDEALDADCANERPGLPSIADSETLADDPSPSHNGSARKTPNPPASSELSPPYLSPSALEDTKPYSMGAGLANLGNTCFINAVLQCLIHTVPLVDGIRSLSHKLRCDRGDGEFCVLCDLHEHIELSLSSSGLVVSPGRLVDNISNISPFFHRFRQEDAHEFLQFFLDKLDSCFPVSQSVQNDNLVKQVFGGSLISKLRCCNCDRCSDCHEPIIDLSLEIKDADSLSSALRSFTALEKIGGPETKFTCENCKEDVTAEKQLLLDKVPLVVAFHLKRFMSDGVYVEKIDKRVSFPLDIDLQPFSNCTPNDNEELKYKLYAIVVHAGNSSNSGHYFCFIRSSPGIWHLLDDEKVTRVAEDAVLAQEAYILFYAKQNISWFSSFMESVKSCAAASPISVIPPLPFAFLNGELRDQESLAVPEASSRNPAGGGTSPRRDEKFHTPKKAPVENGDVAGEESNAFRLLTPPRSPSPDAFSPEMAFLIPRDHLARGAAGGRRAWNQSSEDANRDAAVRSVKRMPACRSTKLMAALISSSHTGGSLAKRSRRMASPPEGAPLCHTRRKSLPGH